MTPQDFIAKWGAPDGVPGPAYTLNEEQGAQSHFLDLCELLGVPKPGSAESYRFEEKNQVIGGRTGYADVFMRGVFAWENKAPGKNLDAALKQLLTYSLALSNPPILVVSDRQTIRIHTQFTGHPSETHEVKLEQLDQPDKLALLRRIWTAPDSFKPRETNRDITEAAARSFATLADGLRKRGAKATDSALAIQQRANQVAHFLTQCLFCFFAEDVGLLPERIFQKMINAKLDLPTRDGALPSEKLTRGLATLFVAMRTGDLFGVYDIARFNGDLFKTIAVPPLTIMEVTELRNAAALNWSAIDVSIFGTLFERGLDPAKRSQLGAHYTDPATILRIVEPVVQRPLLQLWEQEKSEIQALLANSTKRQGASIKLPGRRKTAASAGDRNYQQAQKVFLAWLDHLRGYRVLDPACGSGNFLFLGLKALKDIEHRSHLDAAALGLDREADLVTGPHNVLGIEINEYAAELARVTVWIGELQWRLAHGYEFKTNPVLEPLDHIECRDALLSWDSAGHGSGSEFEDGRAGSAHSEARAGQVQTQATEAPWPKASVVIGNPPFLGDKKMRAELGHVYTETLRKTYEGRVPGGADLVCYWFEKARKAIETNGLGAAGLVATNSIRQAANRKVLDRVCQTTRIYDAWSDEPWVNEGAAVRVSLVSMGWGDCCYLNSQRVARINADLTDGTQGFDLTVAQPLTENGNSSFFGLSLAGPFTVDGKAAHAWLRSGANPDGRSNSEVIRPIWNGADIARRAADRWVIDFASMNETSAALYELPFEHLVRHVKPVRASNRETVRVEKWWRHGRPRPELRLAIRGLARFIVTSETSKHRYFVWCPASIAPEHKLVVIPRSDDVSFGILSSRFHVVWALANGSSLEDRPVYTTSRCFEPFPFPRGLTPTDTAHQQTEEVEGGALIPAGLADTPTEAGAGRMSGATSKSPKDAERQPSAPPPPREREWPSRISSPPRIHEEQEAQPTTKQCAITIANAAQRLNQLRNNWLNPPEWTHNVPEVIPLGMEKSPYPDRIEPKPGLNETDLKALQKRTLTKLYNDRPAWLAMAHRQLDAAVAAAYRWTDYSPDMPDEEVLKRLLALNLDRANTFKPQDTKI